MNLQVCLLALGMLGTGTLNTITTKYQDLVVVGKNPDGSDRLFQHPAVQSAMMFLGELLCLLPYAVSYWVRHTVEDKGSSDHISERRRDAHSVRTVLAFAIPAACDACATTLLNVGLFYTYASAYQMLRGTLVFFAGLLTVALLKRQLHIHHWLGMCLIIAGAVLVGMASMIEPEGFDPYDPYDPDYDDDLGGGGGSVHRLLFFGRRGLKAFAQLGGQHSNGNGITAPAPLLGDVLVILAQLAAASQFIIEEKYLIKYRVPALLAVGIEGAWGLLICAAVCPVLSFVKHDGRPLDSFPDAMREIATHRTLLVASIGSIASIAFFNTLGVKVTKRLSGAARAAIDATRTLFIWGFALAVGWEPTQPPVRIFIQVLGFIVLLAGSSMYNELLRSCLPSPQQPLQAQQPDVQDPLLQLPSPIRARPRSIHNNLYSMARSMRLFPQALSPHSMSSVRFSMPRQGTLTRNDSSFRSMAYSYESTPSMAAVGGGEEGRAGELSGYTPPLMMPQQGQEQPPLPAELGDDRGRV